MIIRGITKWILIRLLCTLVCFTISTKTDSSGCLQQQVQQPIEHYNQPNTEDSDEYGKVKNTHEDENVTLPLQTIKNHETNEFNFSNNSITNCGIFGNQNLTEIYLAGYDDQIIQLRDEILNHTGGNEVEVHFFLHKDLKYQNLGKIRTDIEILKKTIAKYTHYYCLHEEMLNSSWCVDNLMEPNEKSKVDNALRDEQETINKDQYVTKEETSQQGMSNPKYDVFMLPKGHKENLTSTPIEFEDSTLKPIVTDTYYKNMDILNPGVEKWLSNLNDDDKYNITEPEIEIIHNGLELNSKTNDISSDQISSFNNNVSPMFTSNTVKENIEPHMDTISQETVTNDKNKSCYESNANAVSNNIDGVKAYSIPNSCNNIHTIENNLGAGSETITNDKNNSLEKDEATSKYNSERLTPKYYVYEYPQYNVSAPEFLKSILGKYGGISYYTGVPKYEYNNKNPEDSNLNNLGATLLLLDNSKDTTDISKSSVKYEQNHANVIFTGNNDSKFNMIDLENKTPYKAYSTSIFDTIKNGKQEPSKLYEPKIHLTDFGTNKNIPTQQNLDLDLTETVKSYPKSQILDKSSLKSRKQASWANNYLNYYEPKYNVYQKNIPIDKKYITHHPLGCETAPRYIYNTNFIPKPPSKPVNESYDKNVYFLNDHQLKSNSTFTSNNKYLKDGITNNFKTLFVNLNPRNRTTSFLPPIYELSNKHVEEKKDRLNSKNKLMPQFNIPTGFFKYQPNLLQKQKPSNLKSTVKSKTEASFDESNYSTSLKDFYKPIDGIKIKPYSIKDSSTETSVTLKKNNPYSEQSYFIPSLSSTEESQEETPNIEFVKFYCPTNFNNNEVGQITYLKNPKLMNILPTQTNNVLYNHAYSSNANIEPEPFNWAKFKNLPIPSQYEFTPQFTSQLDGISFPIISRKLLPIQYKPIMAPYKKEQENVKYSKTSSPSFNEQLLQKNSNQFLIPNQYTDASYCPETPLKRIWSTSSSYDHMNTEYVPHISPYKTAISKFENVLTFPSREQSSKTDTVLIPQTTKYINSNYKNHIPFPEWLVQKPVYQSKMATSGIYNKTEYGLNPKIYNSFKRPTRFKQGFSLPPSLSLPIDSSLSSLLPLTSSVPPSVTLSLPLSTLLPEPSSATSLVSLPKYPKLLPISSTVPTSIHPSISLSVSRSSPLSNIWSLGLSKPSSRLSPTLSSTPVSNTTFLSSINAPPKPLLNSYFIPLSTTPSLYSLTPSSMCSSNSCQKYSSLPETYENVDYMSPFIKKPIIGYVPITSLTGQPQHSPVSPQETVTSTLPSSFFSRSSLYDIYPISNNSVQFSLSKEYMPGNTQNVPLKIAYSNTNQEYSLPTEFAKHYNRNTHTKFTPATACFIKAPKHHINPNLNYQNAPFPSGVSLLNHLSDTKPQLKYEQIHPKNYAQSSIPYLLSRNKMKSLAATPTKELSHSIISPSSLFTQLPVKFSSSFEWNPLPSVLPLSIPQLLPSVIPKTLYPRLRKETISSNHFPSSNYNYFSQGDTSQPINAKPNLLMNMYPGSSNSIPLSYKHSFNPLKTFKSQQFRNFSKPEATMRFNLKKASSTVPSYEKSFYNACLGHPNIKDTSPNFKLSLQPYNWNALNQRMVTFNPAHPLPEKIFKRTQIIHQIAPLTSASNIAGITYSPSEYSNIAYNNMANQQLSKFDIDSNLLNFSFPVQSILQGTTQESNPINTSLNYGPCFPANDVVTKHVNFLNAKPSFIKPYSDSYAQSPTSTISSQYTIESPISSYNSYPLAIKTYKKSELTPTFGTSTKYQPQTLITYPFSPYPHKPIFSPSLQKRGYYTIKHDPFSASENPNEIGTNKKLTLKPSVNPNTFSLPSINYCNSYSASNKTPTTTSEIPYVLPTSLKEYNAKIPQKIGLECLPIGPIKAGFEGFPQWDTKYQATNSIHTKENQVQQSNNDVFRIDQEGNINIPLENTLTGLFKENQLPTEASENNKATQYLPFQQQKATLLPDITIFRFNPSEAMKNVTMKTNNPDIMLTAWKSKLKLIRSRIVSDIFDVEAVNFKPIVKSMGRYSKGRVEEIMKEYVQKNYGKPIVLRGVYDVYTPYVLYKAKVDVNGKVYLIWPTLCQCGCNKIGCQCQANLLHE